MTGRIINISNTTGWGKIRYGKSIIRFHRTSLNNLNKKQIKIGRAVRFDFFNVGGEEEAVNISFISPIYVENQFHETHPPDDRIIKYKKDRIIKYNYENWEELEKIIDEDTTKTISPLESEKYIKSLDTKSIALAFLDNKLKLVSLTKDDRFNYLDETYKYHNIIYPFHFEEASLSLAIEEFEDLINSKLAIEDDFQKFFERNPNFILNDDYKQAHPHIVLAKEGRDKLIPDFVLEPYHQETFCDLLELKLPSANIFVMKKNRQHFSAHITEAASQLRVYRDYFNDLSNRNKFESTYPHLKIYKPKMFLIIGRRTNYDPLIKRDIQAEHPQLVINNFDDLLARMKWKRDKIKDNNRLFK